MSVYVGILFDCIRNRNWHYDQACHLFADTAEELGVFAERLGLRPSWFQNKPHGLDHYDLTAGKRKEAVAKGAIECDRQQEGTFIRAAKARKKMDQWLANQTQPADETTLRRCP